MAKEVMGYCPECGHPFYSGDGQSDYNYDFANCDCTCEECGWEGTDAELIPVDDYVDMWENGYDDDALEGYEIVCFPESQSVAERPAYDEHCWFINDEEGLETYGSCAYVVEANWLHENE